MGTIRFCDMCKRHNPTTKVNFKDCYYFDLCDACLEKVKDFVRRGGETNEAKETNQD